MGLTSTMEGFKNKPEIVAKYGKNINLVNLGNEDRDELSRFLNITKNEYENVLTDDKGNALNLDELVEKAQSKYGMTNLTKEKLFNQYQYHTSRNKVNTLVNSIVQNEIRRKKDIEETPTPRPTQTTTVTTTQQQDSDGGGISEPDYGSGGIEAGQQAVEDATSEYGGGESFVGIAKGGLLKKKPKVKKR